MVTWKTPSCIYSCQLCIKSEVCCGTVGRCGDGWKLRRIAGEARNMTENALSILIVIFSVQLQQTEISERKAIYFPSPFWKINIFMKTAVFVIFVPKSLNTRSEWGSIKECNKYPCVILNIPDVVAKNVIRSCFVPIPSTIVITCYVPKCTILTWSCFVPTWIVCICSWCCCVATSGASLTHCALFTFVTCYLANRRTVSYILNSIFKLK